MKIAIVKLSALGDIIHAMIALQFIKREHPEIKIDWIVEERFKDILEHNPHINQIHTVNLRAIKQKKSLILLFRELKKIYQLGRSGQYDLVIDAQGLLKSAIVAKVLGGQKITGFDKHSIRESLASYFYHQKIKIAYDENTIARNIAVICRPLNIHPDKQAIINKQPFLFFTQQDNILETPYVMLIVHSTWPSRNYPKEKFVEIANILAINCWVSWHTQAEKAKAQWLAEQSDHINILPELTLNELKHVISQACLLIGNDTGPSYIAWGLNVPSITIFGPTPVNRIYQTPICKAIKSHSIANHYKLDKNDYSITEIAVADIVKLAKPLLKKI